MAVLLPKPKTAAAMYQSSHEDDALVIVMVAMIA